MDKLIESMAQDDLDREYRKLLRDAILEVTQQVLEEQREDILRRAKLNVELKRELSAE